MNVNVTGVQGIGAVGSVLVWAPVNTSQTPGWSSIIDTQSPAWVAVNDSQSPNWTVIAA